MAVKFTDADYEAFDKALEVQQQKIRMAVEEVHMAIAFWGNHPPQPHGSINVANLSKPNSDPPVVCRHALNILSEALSGGMIQGQSLEHRLEGLGCLNNFLLHTKIVHDKANLEFLQGNQSFGMRRLDELLQMHVPTPLDD